MDKQLTENCDTTYNGLLQWYEAMIEKYGWILLVSKKDRNSPKVEHYLSGIRKLYDKLGCYKNQTTNMNKKRDIHVMRNNLYILFGEFIQKSVW